MALQLAAQADHPQIETPLAELKLAVQSHFKKEEPLYRILDDQNRSPERAMMHQMRNDHAAVIFTLESLGIRFRKTGMTPEWRERLKSMLDVLLPHFEKEEHVVFPKSLEILTSDEIASLNGEGPQPL